jgi:membrane protein implicated in regulation of membrane protease activity
MSFWTETAELVWFIVGLVLALAEFIMPGLVIIFFGAGAWITALALMLGVIETFNEQLLVFLVSSIVSLVLFRKQGQHYFEGKVSGRLAPEESLEDVRGKKAVTLTAIKPKMLGGKVEYNGTPWSAEAEVEIEPGAAVEIIGRDNLTLKVKPLS